jgi:hypothetical protein
MANGHTEEGIVFGRRCKLASGIAIAALVLVAGPGSGAAIAGQPPDWQKALTARSQALDHKYRLDKYAASIAHRYHLGVATRTAASTGAPDWLKALIVRSDALDREYGLGAYATIRK